MKNFSLTGNLLFVLLLTLKLNAQNKTDSLLEPAFVKSISEKVVSWQINEFEKGRNRWPKWDWTNGAFYTGVSALSEISPNKKYQEFLIDIGKANNWNTGPRRFFGDDYCVAQTYAQLYIRYKQPEMIAKFRLLADSIVARQHNEPLDWKNNIQLREWAWCDALFMAPPALAYLSTATGDMKYLQKADSLWWKTTDFLFDDSEDLYFRDQRYLNQREANGKKMFWARGNGWVMGGLVRMINNMPADYKNKNRFVELFKKMSARIASLQQPDGTWHTALLDPASYPSKETSGTGFYAYALAWGIRNGYLSQKEYFPVLQKAWAALVSSVHPDGKLGYVQKIGEKPGAVDFESTEVYGPGAFLLTASELYQLLQPKTSLQKKKTTVKNSRKK